LVCLLRNSFVIVRTLSLVNLGRKLTIETKILGCLFRGQGELISSLSLQ
jgi:hypothetical protein